MSEKRKIVLDKKKVKKGTEILQVVPAYVSVELGATINTGNFENIKITVGMTLPCDSENRNKVYEDILIDLQQKLSTQMKLIRDHR